ncbi:MAG TPA: hypothetical protein ENJ77_01660 [Candidatus Moranbacteria bacterium]|nr:hypothetical protein [Candidatus Moranbacteria bacterium]
MTIISIGHGVDKQRNTSMTKKLLTIATLLSITIIALGTFDWLKYRGYFSEEYRREKVFLETEKSRETLGQIDTSDWQTYVNTKYRFEIKYPRDWDVRIREHQIVFGDTLFDMII